MPETETENELTEIVSQLGKYEGKKSSKNKLSKWGKEDWQTREEYEKKKK